MPGKLSYGRDRRDAHGHMGRMLVGRIVRVDHTGGSPPYQRFEIRDEMLPPRWIFDRCAGVAELLHKSVLPDLRRGPLFIATGETHLRVAVGSERTRPSAPSAIGARDATKPAVGITVTLGYAVKRHKFKIVLVGSNAKMGGAAKRGLYGDAVGDE